MRLDLDKEGIFIPSFNHNKELAAADQITVRYRMPTVAIKNRCRRKPQAKGIAGRDGSLEHMEILIDKDSTATLTEMLISIGNCSYREGDGKETSITSAQQLLNAPIAFELLLKEIVDEFDRVLDNGELNEKN
jgi:hypothetical protein